MRIVDRKTFLAMPAGTVFSDYRPAICGPIEVKTRTHGNDFSSLHFEGAARIDDGEQPVDAYFDMQDGNVRPLEVYEQRAGDFNDEQLYLIYEREDVQGIIALLQRALEGLT